MDAKIAGNERIRELLAAALDGQLSDTQAEELAGLDAALVKGEFRDRYECHCRAYFPFSAAS